MGEPAGLHSVQRAGRKSNPLDNVRGVQVPVGGEHQRIHPLRQNTKMDMTSSIKEALKGEPKPVELPTPVRRRFTFA